jgi:hypothetical protein
MIMSIYIIAATFMIFLKIFTNYIDIIYAVAKWLSVHVTSSATLCVRVQIYMCVCLCVCDE